MILEKHYFGSDDEINLQNLDGLIADQIFDGGIYINKRRYMRLSQLVNTNSYDTEGEFFWRFKNKIRPFPPLSVLVIN